MNLLTKVGNLLKSKDKGDQFDFESKMYIHVCPKFGIRLLKHFTLNGGKQQISRWRWISLCGKAVVNLYISTPLKECPFMFETPEEAVEVEGGVIYEFDNVKDMLHNWDKTLDFPQY